MPSCGIWRKLSTLILNSSSIKFMKFPVQLTTNLKQRLSLGLILPLALVGAIALPPHEQNAQAQTNDKRALIIRSDIQEANTQTGVFTARGRVQMEYPARQIQATAAQAQYFDRDRRIILTGNVYVLQEGNSIRGEVVTYLLDENRFVAEPSANQQVESIYLINDPQAAGR